MAVEIRMRFLKREVVAIELAAKASGLSRSEYCKAFIQEYVCWVQRCRVCGCTQNNCEQCIEKTGEPCHWVQDDLCSACVPVDATPKPKQRTQ